MQFYTRIITIDFEEWYHQLSHPVGINYTAWPHLEGRIEGVLDFLLDSLEKYNIKTTFFTVGALAVMKPKLVKRVLRHGHKLGLHSFNHLSPLFNNEESIYKDLLRNKAILEELCSYEVDSSRLPGFGINNKSAFMWNVLKNLNIKIDSSVKTNRSLENPFLSYPYPEPHTYIYNDHRIKEFPLNNSFFNLFPFIGGGYFRITPFFYLKNRGKRIPYYMSYFHPRDFDPGMKFTKTLGLLRWLRMTAGTKYSQKKFDRWLSHQKPVGLQQAVDNIDWLNATTYEEKNNYYP
jgi:peptidoglycan/xylan/chitin deacetylase (PgdA/CDA1 family)